jgi:hypothetical protein
MHSARRWLPSRSVADTAIQRAILAAVPASPHQTKRPRQAEAQVGTGPLPRRHAPALARSELTQSGRADGIRSAATALGSFPVVAARGASRWLLFWSLAWSEQKLTTQASTPSRRSKVRDWHERLSVRTLPPDGAARVSLA